MNVWTRRKHSERYPKAYDKEEEMRVGFSELQFAYSCTRELEKGALFPSIGVPYFPSLYEESRIGADVVFGTPISPVFIQYKVAEYMVRSDATYRKLFGKKFFQFPIYPANKSPQHNLLVNLSLRQPYVYYCSSTFQSYNEFELSHISQTVVSRSIFIPVRGLPHNVGSNRHNIVFQLSPLKGYWCSDPMKIELSDWDEVVADVMNKQFYINYDESFPNKLLETMLQAIGQAGVVNSNNYRITENSIWSWKLISDLLGKYFNETLLLLDYNNLNRLPSVNKVFS